MRNRPNDKAARSPAIQVSEWKITQDVRDGLVLLPDRQMILRCSPSTAARLDRGQEHLLPQERVDWERVKGFASQQRTCAEVERGLAPTDGYSFALNLNLTDACNLACTYCFAQGGSYGTLKDVSMQSDIIPHVRALVRSHGPKRSRIEFFGGEPLLRSPLIAELTRALASDAQAAGASITFRISTNLTTLDAEMIELFARHRFIVSVSIDGTQRTHDRNRPGKGGVTYYDTILRNTRRLRATGEDLTLVARVTATGGEARLWKEVHALNDLALFDWFQILPVTLRHVDGARIQEHFEELYANYPLLFEAHPRFQGILETEFLVSLLQTRRFAPAFCSAGRAYFTLAQDRRLYPCHRLIGDQRHVCGNSEDGPAERELTAWRAPDHRPAACRGCWMRYLCSGGCKHDHLVQAGRLDSASSTYCAFQEMTCTTALRICADRLGHAQNRAEELSRLFVSCGRPSVPIGAWTSPPPRTANFTVVDPLQARAQQ